MIRNVTVDNSVGYITHIIGIKSGYVTSKGIGIMRLNALLHEYMTGVRLSPLDIQARDHEHATRVRSQAQRKAKRTSKRARLVNAGVGKRKR